MEKIIARPKTVCILSLGNNDCRISTAIKPSQKWKVFYPDDSHIIVANGQNKIFMTSRSFDMYFEIRR